MPLGRARPSPPSLTRTRRTALAATALAASALATGCAAPPARDLVRVEAGEYDTAFAAALDAARDDGLPPALRDRRGGVIETDAAVAPSLLEPWRPGGTFDDRLEQTIALRRRRIRFEFTPVAFDPGVGDRPADLLALEALSPDLTREDGPLELRVWVYLEQSHSPGLRPSTWSRSLTTQTRIIPPGSSDPLPELLWIPVARDLNLERRLLTSVDQELARCRAPLAR